MLEIKIENDCVYRDYGLHLYVIRDDEVVSAVHQGVCLDEDGALFVRFTDSTPNRVAPMFKIPVCDFDTHVFASRDEAEQALNNMYVKVPEVEFKRARDGWPEDCCRLLCFKKDGSEWSGLYMPMQQVLKIDGPGDVFCPVSEFIAYLRIMWR